MRIPLIIITKGVDESIDLHSKLMNFSDLQHKIVVVSSKKDKEGRSQKNDSIETALRTGGVLVTADTEPQILKTCKALQKYRDDTDTPNHGKFLLVIDEADAMLWRTDDESQHFERALHQLRSMLPSVTAYISATPLPFLLRLHLTLEKNDSLDLFKLAPGDNYVGLESTEIIKSKEGDPIFLENNELNCNTAFEGIPYTNEKVIALYDNALFDNDGSKKGTLLLGTYYHGCIRLNDHFSSQNH